MSDKKLQEPQPQPPCPHCDCIHLGQQFDDCPNLRMKPCEICGQPTLYACSDCQIERRETVHVCVKSECRDAHEAKHPEHPRITDCKSNHARLVRLEGELHPSGKDYRCEDCGDVLEVEVKPAEIGVVFGEPTLDKKVERISQQVRSDGRSEYQ